MTKPEWQVAEAFLKSVGVKPRIIESRDGQGNLNGLVVWFSADNVKFTVDYRDDQPVIPQKSGKRKK